MEATLNILYAQTGFYTDENTGEKLPWANAYTFSDPAVTPNMVGVKPGKMPIQDNFGTASHEVANQLLAKLRDAKSFPCPVKVKIGNKVKDGSMTMTIVQVL